MTFFPVYIPIPSSGGGPVHPVGAMALLGIAGGIAWIYNNNIKPRADLKIKYNKYSNGTIYVYKKEDNYPHSVKYSTMNYTCLADNGYNIAGAPFASPINRSCIYSISRKDNKPISKDKFLADCKECNVKTTLQYKYLTIFLGYKKVKKEVAWQDAFKDRDE
jgi:hypothetical protein